MAEPEPTEELPQIGGDPHNAVQIRPLLTYCGVHCLERQLLQTRSTACLFFGLCNRTDISMCPAGRPVRTTYGEDFTFYCI